MRINKYPAECHICNELVHGGAGYRNNAPIGKKQEWRVYHKTCYIKKFAPTDQQKKVQGIKL